MNILLINHYAGSVHYGMEYRPFYMAKEWVKQGHKVTILASSESHIRTKRPMLKAKSQDENIEGITYRWYKTSTYHGNGVARIVNILSFIWSLWKDRKQIINEFHPDVVIASSTYPMDIWPAKSIAKKANAKLIYEVHDLWPLSPMELGGLSRWNPFIMWCQWAENDAYRYSDKVISMLPLAKEHMLSHGMQADKFHYVGNGINVAEWENIKTLPSEIRERVAKVKELGRPIIGYAGTHGLANSLDMLLDAAKLGAGQFEVVFIGMGPDREHLLQRVAKENIVNVTMLAAVPKECIPDFLSMIDIAYIGLLPQPLFRFGISPNKLMDYMMAEKPVLMAINAGNDLVSEAKCGLSVSPGDAAAVYEGVLQLLSLSVEDRVAMGSRGRDFILKRHVYSVLSASFIEYLSFER